MPRHGCERKEQANAVGQFPHIALRPRVTVVTASSHRLIDEVPHHVITALVESR